MRFIIEVCKEFYIYWQNDEVGRGLLWKEEERSIEIEKINFKILVFYLGWYFLRLIIRDKIYVGRYFVFVVNVLLDFKEESYKIKYYFIKLVMSYVNLKIFMVFQEKLFKVDFQNELL